MCETGWIVRASSRTAASTRSSRGGDVPLLAQAAVRFTLASGNEAPTSHRFGFPLRRGDRRVSPARRGADCRNDMPLQTRRRRQNGRHRPKPLTILSSRNVVRVPPGVGSGDADEILCDAALVTPT